ncbi:MAG: RNA ligase family protein [Egibacteraceae bacterium]
MNLPSYPKVWNIGHPSIHDLFLDEVLVQEKVDGSQFSFAMPPQGEGYGVKFRSKGAEVVPGAAGMFTPGVEAILEIADKLTPGIIYRGEFLAKPKHNALKYDRVPARHVALFDIHRFASVALDPAVSETTLHREAERLGMEVVPDFFFGRITDMKALLDLLNQTSFLGGPKVEGVVVKNYVRYHLQTSDPMFGKYVSEDFKEKHTASWRLDNPRKADVLAALVSGLATERRWEKAVEHLRDSGRLAEDLPDIGPLIHAVQKDVEDECAEEIKDVLFRWAWPQIKRKVAAGLPDWYKKRLAAAAFEPVTEAGEGD